MNYPKLMDPVTMRKLWDRLIQMFPSWKDRMGPEPNDVWSERLQEFSQSEVFNGLAELLHSNQQAIPSIIQFVDFIRLGMQKSQPQKKKEEWKPRTEEQKKNAAAQCEKMRAMIRQVIQKTEVRSYDRNAEIDMDDIRHLYEFFVNVYGKNRASNHVTEKWYDELVGIRKGQLETARYLILRNYNPDSPGPMPDALGVFRLCTGEPVIGFER